MTERRLVAFSTDINLLQALVETGVAAQTRGAIGGDKRSIGRLKFELVFFELALAQLRLHTVIKEGAEDPGIIYPNGCNAQ